MDRLKSALRSPTHAYKEVRYSQSDDDERGSEVSTEESLREHIAVLESNIWCLRMSLLITVATLIVVTIFAISSRVSYVKAAQKWSIGSDPNGFVPPEIGEPPRWKLFDKTDPYYIEEDTFESLDKTKMVIKRLKSLHNSSNVLVNGNFANWKKPDGSVGKLPAYYSTISYRQTYIIRSFHQMHCLISIAEEYGHRANDAASQWPSKHVAHCLNAIREAIMCLADATPMTYVNGFAVGHVTDDQQFMCRDWTALRRWANEPVRGIRYKNLAPEGAEYDNYTEIIPFPELSEEEKSGLA
ncbi:Cyclochlorotine biosynthesis protein R [Colletotrichum trifolii]|uniref:Cyclochlorotine biosynthesis protein R n=1 Tax=Colletotrichum trifolii TaxID=5466 RepID=A0A4R8RNC6_COLTR|nr:Cyclochlorotine biosynthesis protein R [Colletotrichum trifolii]